MIGIGISPFRRKPPASSIPTQAEATALFAQWDALGTSASASRKTIVNATIYYLKQAGIWDELDMLYVWAAHSQTAALVDWRNPSTRAATITGTTTFLADNYLKGNGSTGRVNLNYNPGDGGTYKFTQNVNSFGVYVTEHVNETKVEISALNGSSQGNEVVTTVTSFTLTGRDNSGTLRGITNHQLVGLLGTVRTASNSWRHLRNGYDLYSNNGYETDASLSVPNIGWWEFCRNTNGTFSQYSSKKHSYSFAGGNINQFTLSRIMEWYYLKELNVAPTKRVTFNGNSFTAAGTYQARVLSTIGYTYDINSRGISGQTTPQMQTDAVTSVFDKTKTYLVKDIYFVWELTNDMAANSSNVTTCYNNMVTYLQALRAAVGSSAKIIVATCLPRSSASMNNANRQNDADLFDDTTLNGKIRNHLVQDGYCDAICDVASDATMGIYSGGVAGVGEKNTTYYNVDEIHPNTTGYQYLADNYITASIQAYL